MKKRMKALTACTVILLEITQQTGIPNPAASQPHNNQTSQDFDSQSGKNTSTSNDSVDSPIILQSAGDGGIYGAFKFSNDSDFNLAPQDRILKIDNTFTKGCSVKDLQKLLEGKAGTSFTIDILSARNNELARHTVVRKSVQPRVRSGAYSTILGAFDIFDRPTRFHSSLMIAKTNAERGANLFAGALLKDLQNYRPFVHPNTAEPEIVIALPFSISFFDRSGMFKESDSAIKFAIDASKVPLKNRGRNEILALCEVGDYLRETKRPELSNTIWSNLNATVGDAKPAEQIKFFAGYSKFLNQNMKYGDAASVYERLDTLCIQNPSSIAAAALSDVADLYEERNKHELAQKALRNLADMRQNLADKTFDKLYRNQGFLSALLRLADSFASSGNNGEAVIVLKEGLNTYDRDYSAEEIVRLERATTPCYSQLEARIGELEIKNGKPEEARKFLESAITRIEGSLGVNAPQLKAPLIALASVEQSAVESRKLKSRADQLLTPVTETSGEKIDLDFLEARTAFDLIESKSFKLASASISKMIDKANNRASIDPFLIYRLVALSNAYGADNTAALSILKQLASITEPENNCRTKVKKASQRVRRF